LTGRKEIESVITAARGNSILTVGDNDAFIELGGMVRFVQDRNRVKFQINQNAAVSEKLNISSKLLRLAEVVSIK
jgi:hypothetical protein